LLKCAMQTQAAFELRMVHIDEHFLVCHNKRCNCAARFVN
jgi:hypothetical protein